MESILQPDLMAVIAQSLKGAKLPCQGHLKDISNISDNKPVKDALKSNVLLNVLHNGGIMYFITVQEEQRLKCCI